MSYDVLALYAGLRKALNGGELVVSLYKHPTAGSSLRIRWDREVGPGRRWRWVWEEPLRRVTGPGFPPPDAYARECAGMAQAAWNKAFPSISELS